MIIIKCKNCQTTYKYDDSELDYECVETDSSRKMGNENTYEGKFEFDCEKCNKHLLAEFIFWEYPANAFNYSENKTEGCEILEEPNYQGYLQQSENDED